MTDDDIARIVGRLDKSDEESQGFTDALRRARSVHEAYEHGCYDQPPAFNDDLITALAEVEARRPASEPYRANIGTELLDLFDSYGIEHTPATLAAALVACSYLTSTVDAIAELTCLTSEGALAEIACHHRAATEAVAQATLLAITLAGEASP